MSASESQIKAAQAKQEIVDLFHRVFTTAEGKRVLEIMKERAFYNRSLMHGIDRTDSHTVAYREGQRNFVMEVEAFVKQGTEGTPRMQGQALSATAEEKS